MSILYGPDGKPISKGPPAIEEDVLARPQIEIDDSRARARAVKSAMEFIASRGRNFIAIMRLAEAGDPRVVIGGSDKHGDCPVLFEDEDTGHRVSEHEAQKYRRTDWGAILREADCEV